MNDQFIYDDEEHIFYLPDKSITYEALYEEKVIKNEELGKVIFYSNNIKLFISKNSKFIKFINDDREYNIFICEAGQIYFLIEHFGFKKYIVLKNGVETNNTLLSLDFDTIKKVDNYLKEDEYIKVNRPFINNSKILLESLSVLYDKYQKYNISSNEFRLSKEREVFYQKLKSLINKSNFVAICGPKSIGKTTSLLYFKHVYILKSFYVNLSYCKKIYELNNIEELHLSICRELFSCLTFKEVNEVYSFLEKNEYN